MSRLIFLLFFIPLISWSKDSTRSKESISNGTVEIKWHNYEVGHTLNFYRNNDLVESFEPYPSGSRYDFENSTYVGDKENPKTFLFSIWSHGVRTQSLVIFNLYNFKVLKKIHSEQEINIEKINKDTYQINYIIKNEANQLEAKEELIQLSDLIK
ncbi:MAG: hypothetical protein KDD58_07910 [Bdellovibrionales bacterium]|nr:hypothetical protein [Bdellovibrionales bacterium]